MSYSSRGPSVHRSGGRVHEVEGWSSPGMWRMFWLWCTTGTVWRRNLKKIWQWPVNYVRKQKKVISKAKRKRVGATDRSVSPQTSPTGEGEGGGGASGYTSSTWDISLSFKHTHTHSHKHKGEQMNQDQAILSLTVTLLRHSSQLVPFFSSQAGGGKHTEKQD